MKDQPSDRPEILVDASDLLGRKTTQAIRPEVNRLHPDAEFQLGWAAILLMPPTLCDLLLQIGTWVGLGAFSITALALLDFPALLTYPVGLVAIGFLVIGATAALNRPLIALPLLYRCALVAVGIALSLWEVLR